MELTDILARLKGDWSQYYRTKKVVMKSGGTYSADFINGADLYEILDQCTGGYWEWDCQVSLVGGAVVVTGMLTIIDENGARLSRTATGNKPDKPVSFGDPVSNAEAMAFRRACSKFGIGRELWQREGDPTRSTTRTRTTTPGTISRDEWYALQQAKTER